MVAKRVGAGEVTTPVEMDPAYMQALDCMQQGQWSEASDALAKIDERYAKSASMLALRQRLALHLSAEETWANDAGSRLPPLLRPRIVRMLLVANVVIYLLLAIGWLLGLWTGLLG